VTLYLLDENVLRELKRGGHKNVHQWISTVDDTDLRISVATLFETRRGAEALMKRDPQRARDLQWYRRARKVVCRSPHSD
jgi:predicted nucleic acid-binding protein